MSSSPKYSSPTLSPEAQAKLRREREQREREEARRRAEIAERERQNRIRTSKNKANSDVDWVKKQINGGANIFTHDVQRLTDSCEKLALRIKKSDLEDQANRVRSEAARLKKELNKALAEKRRHDEGQKRLDALEQLTFEHDELRRKVESLEDGLSEKFDLVGYNKACETIGNLLKSIQRGNPDACKKMLRRAEESVEKHIELVEQKHTQWLKDKADAERANSELNALIEGLRSDATVIAWHSDSIPTLSAMIEDSTRCIAKEDFVTPHEILSRAQKMEKDIISESQSAQELADSRNLIAGAISESLQAMGWVVSPMSLEDKNHPLSALTISATSPAGRAIGASVPAEGDVWYTVDGYPMRTERTTDGSTANTCDEAEQTIEEMHGILEQAFGVRMSELMWDGKRTPDRILRKADMLPKSGSNERKGVRS
ncbi:MAG TPA: hypothetical protein PLN69_06520 [bacterium]|nr:hypothetical protein [bacterium]